MDLGSTLKEQLIQQYLEQDFRHQQYLVEGLMLPISILE
jgi:hypothetical protein